MNFMSQQQQQQQAFFNQPDMFSEDINKVSGKEDSKKVDFRTSFYNPFEVKHRKRTSRAQFKVLEKSFLENPKPNASVRRYLAQKLSMTPRGVQVWFQNRRAKEKTKQPTSTSSTVMTTPPISTISSPVHSVCACTDCFPTPMSRTVSYSFEDETTCTTPITPTDMPQFMYDFFPVYNNNKKINNWAYLPPSRTMYSNPNYSQPINNMIDSSEFFYRLSEPIFDPNMTSFDPSFDLLPRTNSF